MSELIKFEKYARARGLILAKVEDGKEHWPYLSHETNQAWTVWQAAVYEPRRDIEELVTALRPQLSKKSRACLEDLVEASDQDEDGDQLSAALSFLLDRLDKNKLVAAKFLVD